MRNILGHNRRFWLLPMILMSTAWPEAGGAQVAPHHTEAIERAENCDAPHFCRGIVYSSIIHAPDNTNAPCDGVSDYIPSIIATLKSKIIEGKALGVAEFFCMNDFADCHTPISPVFNRGYIIPEGFHPSCVVGLGVIDKAYHEHVVNYEVSISKSYGVQLRHVQRME